MSMFVDAILGATRGLKELGAEQKAEEERQLKLAGERQRQELLGKSDARESELHPIKVKSAVAKASLDETNLDMTDAQFDEWLSDSDNRAAKREVDSLRTKWENKELSDEEYQGSILDIKRLSALDKVKELGFESKSLMEKWRDSGLPITPLIEDYIQVHEFMGKVGGSSGVRSRSSILGSGSTSSTGVDSELKSAKDREDLRGKIISNYNDLLTMKRNMGEADFSELKSSLEKSLAEVGTMDISSPAKGRHVVSSLEKAVAMAMQIKEDRRDVEDFLNKKLPSTKKDENSDQFHKETGGIILNKNSNDAPDEGKEPQPKQWTVAEEARVFGGGGLGEGKVGKFLEDELANLMGRGWVGRNVGISLGLRSSAERELVDNFKDSAREELTPDSSDEEIKAWAKRSANKIYYSLHDPKF